MRDLQVNMLPATLSRPSMLNNSARWDWTKSYVMSAGQSAVDVYLQVVSAVDMVSGAEEDVETPTGIVALLLPKPQQTPLGILE